MPIIESAKKKLRQDKKRQKQNLLVKRQVKEKIKEFKKNPTKKSLPCVFSVLDKAAKKKIFHKNKSSRLKSKLSKLLNKQTTTKKKTASTSKKKEALQKNS